MNSYLRTFLVGAICIVVLSSCIPVLSDTTATLFLEREFAGTVVTVTFTAPEEYAVRGIGISVIGENLALHPLAPVSAGLVCETTVPGTRVYCRVSNLTAGESVSFGVTGTLGTISALATYHCGTFTMCQVVGKARR